MHAEWHAGVFCLTLLEVCYGSSKESGQEGGNKEGSHEEGYQEGRKEASS